MTFEVSMGDISPIYRKYALALKRITSVLYIVLSQYLSASSSISAEA